MSETIIHTSRLKGKGPLFFVGDYVIRGDVPEGTIIDVQGNAKFTGNIGKKSQITVANACELLGYVHSDCIIISKQGDVRIASASNNLVVTAVGAFIASGKIGGNAQITVNGACDFKRKVSARSRIEAESIVIRGYIYNDCTLISTRGNISIKGAADNLKVESAGVFKNVGTIGANPKIVENHNPESRKWQKLAKNRAEEVAKRGGSIFDGGDNDGVCGDAPEADGDTKFASNTGPKTSMDWGLHSSASVWER